MRNACPERIRIEFEEMMEYTWMRAYNKERNRK
jgi:hypothetical protein